MSKGTAIIINSNFVLPDKYKFFTRNKYERRYFKLFGKSLFPLYRVKTGEEECIRFDISKKTIVLFDKNREKDVNKSYAHTKILASRSYSVIFFEDDNNNYYPVLIRKEDGPFTKDMLNTDKWRDFKKNLAETDKVTSDPWERLQQILLVAFLVIMGVCLVVVGFVMLNKFGIEHTQVVNNVVANTTEPGWLNATSNYLGG